MNNKIRCLKRGMALGRNKKRCRWNWR